MIKANSLMREYHEAADRVDLDSRSRAVIVDKADLQIIRLLLGKDVDTVKSMEQAAGEAMQSMIDQFPELALLENPWASFLVANVIRRRSLNDKLPRQAVWLSMGQTAQIRID